MAVDNRGWSVEYYDRGHEKIERNTTHSIASYVGRAQ